MTFNAGNETLKTWGFIISICTSDRANKLCKVLVQFCWGNCVYFSLFVLFNSQKIFERLLILLSFSRVSVLRAFNIFLYRSCICDKSFLAHFFQRNLCLETLCRANLYIFANSLKSKMLLVRHEWQLPRYGSHRRNMVKGSWLDLSFSLRVKKAIRDIWLAFHYLAWLVNENLFCTFSVISQYVYNKNGPVGILWNLQLV